jgi:hypothetical protein
MLSPFITMIQFLSKSFYVSMHFVHKLSKSASCGGALNIQMPIAPGNRQLPPKGSSEGKHHINRVQTPPRPATPCPAIELPFGFSQLPAETQEESLPAGACSRRFSLLAQYLPPARTRTLLAPADASPPP